MQIETPVPDRDEVHRMVLQVKAGAKVNGVRLMRGLVYIGALAAGQAPEVALRQAVSVPSNARVVFSASFK